MIPRVNVVVKPGWILERMANEIRDRADGVTVNAGGWPPKFAEAGATYYLPEKNIAHVPPSGIRIGYFTHGWERVQRFAGQFDVCLAMNATMGRDIVTAGGERMQVIRPGTGMGRRPVFGVCGRVYGKGRKGAHLVALAVAAGFDVRACSEHRGPPPPCPITHAIEDREAFYQSIDYLLVTSTEEGGPMPVIEALAMGVPVIAPDVGWCWEFSVIPYDVGSWPSLLEVLNGLTDLPTWETWGEQHRALFDGLGL